MTLRVAVVGAGYWGPTAVPRGVILFSQLLQTSGFRLGGSGSFRLIHTQGNTARCWWVRLLGTEPGP